MGIDADSFKGKVLLLVIDKIVIGLLIGIALALYHVWSTNNQRQYDQSYRSAEYIKEFVPVIGDTCRSWESRLYSYGALVDTKSVTDDSAIDLANEMLLDGFEQGSIDDACIQNNAASLDTTNKYTSNLINERINYLEKEIFKTLPSSAPYILSTYSRLHSEMSAPGQSYPANLVSTEGFWHAVIVDALTTLKANQLKGFDDPDTFYMLSEATSDLSHYQLDNLRSFDLTSMRLIVNLHDLKDSKSEVALNVLMSNLESHSTLLGGRYSPYLLGLYRALMTYDLYPPQFAEISLATLQNSPEVPSTTTPYFSNSPSESDAVDAAYNYLRWAAENPQIAQTVNKPLIQIVQAHDWKSDDTSASDYHDAFSYRCSRSCEAVNILMHENCAKSTGVMGPQPLNPDPYNDYSIRMAPPLDAQQYLEAIFNTYSNIKWVSVAKSGWASWVLARRAGVNASCLHTHAET